MKKSIQGLLIAAAALAAASALAASSGAVASSVAGIRTLGMADASIAGDGLITLLFQDLNDAAKIAPPSYNAVKFLLDTSVSGGAFVGNYVGGGIDGMKVTVSCSGPAAPVRAWLRTAGGRLWVNDSMVGKSDGVVTYTIPFTSAGGWRRSDKAGTDLDALLAMDLEKVQSLGFEVKQDGLVAQTVSVEDVRLYGDSFMTEAAILSRIAQHFGTAPLSSANDLPADLLAKDSDKDGTTDVADVIAGREVMFLAEVLRSQATASGRGVLLRWPCINGRTYTVYRSLEIDGDYESIARLTAVNNEFMEYEDVGASGLGPYYYRVVRE